MILHSTSTNKKIHRLLYLSGLSVLFAGLFSSVACGDSPELNGFKLDCNKFDSCRVDYVGEARVAIIDEYVAGISIKELKGAGYSEISYSCGSPCTVSIFFGVDRGKSRRYQDVLAVDELNGVVVVADQSELVLYEIFGRDEAKARIALDWADAASLRSVVEKVGFVGCGHLNIEYLSGEDYIEKSELVEAYVCE